MSTFLQIEAEPDVDARAVVVGMDRCNPRSWCNDDATPGRGINRRVGAVVGAIGVLDGSFVPLSVPLVVSLLFLVGVVMVITMGLSGRADTDACDRDQKRCSAETLGERHG